MLAEIKAFSVLIRFVKAQSPLPPGQKDFLPEKRKQDKENLPLSFGKKKVEQRKPVFMPAPTRAADNARRHIRSPS